MVCKSEKFAGNMMKYTCKVNAEQSVSFHDALCF